MSDLVERAKEMPSSLNDACRTIEMLCDEIDSLYAQLASYQQEIGVLRDVLMNPDPDNEPDNVRLHREKCDALDKLASARKALEPVKGLQYYINNPSAWEHFDDEMSERLRPIVDGAILILTDENGK